MENTMDRLSLDRLRRSLLLLGLIFVTIPGIAGLDLGIGGFRLGRFQPFKFLFVGWLVAQAAWVVPGLRARGGLRFSPLGLGLGVSAIVLDACLAAGLLHGGTPGRGWSILLALVLGQVGALLVVLDRSFPRRETFLGVQLACFILLIFSIFELLCPTAPWLLRVLALIRDDGAFSFQLGSTLTTSALAEFCVRALPLTLLFSHRSVASAGASAALLLMGFLTLEKSFLLSLGLMAPLVWISGYGRAWRGRILGVFAAGLLLLIGLKGPEAVVGRYFGMFLPKSASETVRGTHQSVQERKVLWTMAAEVVRTEPWLGIGLDGFAYRHSHRLEPIAHSPMPMSSHTHNLFIETAVSGGLFAFGALVCIVLLTARITWGGGGLSGINYPLALYLAGTVGSALVDCRIYVSWLAITLPWFAALAWQLGLEKPASERR